MPQSIDLNADVGEGFPYDDGLLGVVTSANVACGFHAGDAATMRRVCEKAVELGVAIGAQPSYRDREGFGRRDVEIGTDDLVADLAEQVEALAAAAAEAGAVVSYLKPHGALYNRAVHDDAHARAVVEICRRFALPVLGLPGSRLLVLAAEQGVVARREFFADRGYDGRGRLVPRSEAGAVLTDQALIGERVTALVRDGRVTAIDGSEIAVRADSVCVHGDTPGALDLSRAARAALEAAGISVRAFG